MKLCDMKIGDSVAYPDLFSGVPSPVVLTLESLSSDGKVRSGIFKATLLGINLGFITAEESGPNTTWFGLSL